MSQEYNPIVRVFGRFRTGLLSALDLDRHDFRPETPLEALIPRERRREVWRHLRRLGLDVPALELSTREKVFCGLVMMKTAVWIILSLENWPVLMLTFPLALAEFWLSRCKASDLPSGPRTVGEMVLYLTSFREHKSSGYRWTREEIATKVRLIVAVSLGLPLDAVRLESTLAELGAE